MKQLTFIIAMLLTSIVAHAQLNNLSNTELFDGIQFNNVSLGRVMETKGDLTKIRSLFGNNTQERANNTAPHLAKFIWNHNFSFGFEDESDTGNNYSLSYIKVNSNSVNVNVKGVSIKIGDNKRKLKNFLFNADSSSYNFTDRGTGSIGLSFKIDAAGNVSAIELICY